MIVKSLKISFVTIFLAALPSLLSAQENRPGLVLSHLTDEFYVFTTFRNIQGNPFPSNGLYAITDSGAVIIDTPWDTTQFQQLLDSIKLKHNKEVLLCIATHSHEDRTAGLEYFRRQGIKTYTTRQTDSISELRNEKRAEFIINSDTMFNLGKYSFQTYFGGAGHTSDNIVIWFPAYKILYGGCLIKSADANDLGNLKDADILEWPKTINKIVNRFGKPDFVIPGHQGWMNAEALEHTLSLLRRHEMKKK